MAELARIEARLESFEQLGALVTAMRSVAAVRAREAQEALTGTETFCTTVDRAIARLDYSPPPVSHEETGQPVLLAITTENGFVGGFNTRILEQVRDVRKSDETLVLIGRRGQILAGEMQLKPDIVFPMTSRVSGVTQLARRVSRQLVGVKQARVVFAQHQQSGTFDVPHRKILPLDPLDRPSDSVAPPLHHLPKNDLMDQLAAEYLFAQIAHAMMESLVCEHNARLLTMDAASRNINGLHDKLRREERMARQEQTTSDMLDVIVGSEAVNHG